MRREPAVSAASTGLIFRTVKRAELDALPRASSSIPRLGSERREPAAPVVLEERPNVGIESREPELLAEPPSY